MNLVKRFEKNTKGRDYLISDLHGMTETLEGMLNKVQFDVEIDRLFSVGDLVDRGPDSVEAVSYLDEKWFHSVRGNHEQMFMDVFMNRTTDMALYIANGGEWYFDLSPLERGEIYRKFDRLPLAIEIGSGDEKIGIVHAGCPMADWGWMVNQLNSADLERDLVEDILRSRRRIKEQDTSVVSGVGIIFSGHICVQQPVALGNHLFIDTGAYRADGKLTMVLMSSSFQGRHIQ